jgi:hypothetical protein
VLCVFFREVKQELGAELIREGCEVLREYERFVEIVMDQDERLPLRERMAEAFDRYSNLSVSHRYLSDLVGGRDFDDFFMTIRGEAGRFRRVYNRTLERFRERFRFRFRNYPFPELKEGELPFWVIRDGRRHQFTTDMDDGDVEGYTILPKASPLTLFLRMHHCDLFVHGVGGANYEWVNDRIYEEFFGLDPPRYLVLSGTFHQCGIPERDYPYFFMNPRRLKSLLEKRLHGARGDAGS